MSVISHQRPYLDNVVNDHEPTRDQKVMVQWIKDRINLADFKLSQLWNEEEHSPVVYQFLLDSSVKSMFATIDRNMNNKLIVCCNSPPTPAPGRFDVAYFIRPEGELLSSSNIDDILLFGTFAMHQTASSVLNIMEKVFFPHIFHTTDWNESSRQELMGLYHRFMASLTESANEESGKTTLYLPFKYGMSISDFDNNCGDDNKSASSTSSKRAFVQQLEAIAIHWTRQIKGVLNNHEHDISSNLQGPIEELKYWESRAQDLSGLSVQLQCEEVQRIVSILNNACSKYAQPVQALTDLIEKGLQEAENIVKFLSILQEPCERLSKLRPLEIPSLFPELMNCARLIYSLSSNYNTYERISDLLRRISGQIIRQCSSYVSLGNVFYGEVKDVAILLTQCIECGRKWKELYNRTAVTVNSRMQQQSAGDQNSVALWKENDASIFAEIDAFQQRCEDLIDVCDGRTQFVSLLGKSEETPTSNVAQTLFGGMNGPEIEQTLETVSAGCKTQIDRLHRLEYNVLDARTSQWHYDYNSFKMAMKDLDAMIINVINKAFEQVKVIETAIHLLLSFRKMAHRPAIQLCVSKKSFDVRTLFKKKCQSIRQEFDDFHRKPPLRMNEPQYAGAALWAKALCSTVDDGWILVKESTTKPDNDDLEGFVENLKVALYSYQSQKYNDWLGTFCDMDSASFQQCLNEPLLRKNELKRKDSYPTISSNFDCGIVAIFTEAYFWDKLHTDEFTTPNVILGICHQREVLRLVRERVMMLVRTYNELIEDLSGISELYSDHLKRLEKKIYPGFTKLLWSTRQVVIERFVQACINQIHEVHLLVKTFHHAMKSVKMQCNLLSSVSLVRIDRNVLYKGKLFESQQNDHRDKMKELCTKYHEAIKGEIDNLHHQFSNATQEVQIAWQRYVQSVDRQILGSLFQCVKASLRALSNSVDGCNFNGEPQPLFLVGVILRNGAIECRPSMIEITNSINAVAKELIVTTKSICRFSPSYDLHNNLMNGRAEGTFYEEISSDRNVLNAVVQIMTSTASCISSVQRKLLEWESYRSLWDMDKDSFLRRYSKTKQNTFEKDIKWYQNLDTSIQRERSSVTINFIQLSFSALKSTLSSHSLEFQEKLLDLLQHSTSEKICKLHEFFDMNIRKLRRPIQSIGSLCEITDLLVCVEQRCGQIDEEFVPLEKAYQILGNFDKDRIDQNHEEMLRNLKPKHQELTEQISDAKGNMEKSKVFIKSEFHLSLSNHQDRMSQICTRIEEAICDKSETTTKEASALVKSITSDIEGQKAKEKELEQGLNFFGMELPDRKALTSAENNLHLIEKVLSASYSWQSTWDQWLKTAISMLNIQKMEETCSSYVKDLMKIQRNIRSWTVWKQFREDLDQFKELLPLIRDLLNEGMRERHWDSIGEAICRDFNFSREKFTLGDIFLLGLQRHATLISDLSCDASRELTIERTLEEIEDRLLQTKVEFLPYKDTFKIIGTDDLFTMIEDDIVSLQSIKSSSTAKAFTAKIEGIETDLNRISEFIESFTTMQRQWLYLENIFIGSGGDIKEQLPQEYKMFVSLNDQFKGMMNIFCKEKVIKSISTGDRNASVNRMTLQMEEIQKSLDQYLETKRRSFPRFYFISDDDLLELIGKSKEPEQAQKHLKKCFEGVDSLVFEETNGEDGAIVATAATASDGEVLNFVNYVTIDGSIESWLAKILDEVQLSVKRSLDGCAKSLKSTKRDKWIRDWQGQVLITAGGIYWTRGCSRALEMIESGKDKHSLRSYRKKQVSLLRRLTEMVRDSSQQKLDRSKIVALITMEVHNRDVIEKLIKSGCQDSNNFTWTSQLRFFMEKGKDYGTCNVKQIYCQLSYGYEYQGNNGRLVVTPLTDRCILTLITAKFLHRGGNPLGPAGTGKTETVKDLAKNLGYFCVVSNCSEAMDFKSLGRIFSGLCQSGAWGCFDEFNRIKVEVISVVAMQISAILNALRCDQSTFNFMGSNIHCSTHTGIFITMNPGYAGRSELPDNLKILMRPVAMMSPDLNLIAEVILSAEGFTDSRPLAKKIVTLYKLMQQQLSKQSHYDYGLRSIKGVLTMAGTLKRKGSETDEEIIIIQALKCTNEPKFTKDDSELFRLLLCDLFPDKNMDNDNGGHLLSAIEQAILDSNLQASDFIVKKILQLAHSMKIRHCNMIIGETMSGKTTIWQTLSSAKQLLPTDNDHFSPSVNKYVINPKVLSIEELYGSYDLMTFEWSDGVISSIFKSCSESPKHDVQKWLVFDGPVDALWIESMNSVMDDNRILTLINGDRISLSDSMSLLFEVEDLSVASPATVSRAGMIFIDGDLGWKPFLKSWLHRNADQFKGRRSIIEELCTKYLEPLLSFKEKHCKEPVKISSCAQVRSFTIMCDVFLPRVLEQELAENTSQNELEKWFIFCLVWSIGGAVDESGRELIDKRIRDIDTHFLPTRSIFDYFIDPKTNDFELWQSKVSKYIIHGSPSFHNMIIPTKDTVRNSYILDSLIVNSHRTLLVGSTGSGKTCLAKSLFSKLQDGTSKAIINLSSTIESKELQFIMENLLEKRSKDKLGPASGAGKLVIFIDDLNLPKLTSDESPYQPPLELIRQFIGYSGWYHRKKCSWQNITNTDMVCAMTPPTGGREAIPNRLQSQFHVMNCIEPSEKTAASIFKSILDIGLNSFQSEIKSTFDAISRATYGVYKHSKKVFLPKPGKSHYDFNLRDVFKVAQGMLLANTISIDSKDSFYRLWLHECMRCFSDRFILDTDDDESRFIDILTKSFQQHTNSNAVIIDSQNKDSIKSSVFTSIEIGSNNAVKACYMQVNKKEFIYNSFQERLEDYNNDGSFVKMNLVLFDDALRHLCRVHRILQMERGNMLFIGIGGSGKESITRLAAFTAQMDIFTIEMTKKYRREEFREDLKSLCTKCGIENIPCLFFLKDKHIKKETFLEDVSNLLVSGEVPGLFSKDEIGGICHEVRKDALTAGVGESEQLLWNFFVDRVRKNLHITMAMSPIGSTLASRLRSYPALINYTTINWFNSWPCEALEQVAYKHLSSSDVENGSEKSISECFALIHSRALEVSKDMKKAAKRHNYVTPTNYLELVSAFQKVLKNKNQELQTYKEKLSSGLKKLEDGRAQVEVMKGYLKEKQLVVAQSQKDCEEMLEKIVSEKRAAENQKEVVAKDSKRIEKEEKQCTLIAEEAEADLAIALPALEAALVQVEKLDKSAITEIKAYSKPPTAVEKVLSCVMILLGKQTDWAIAKRVLGETNFLSNLKSFNKDNVKDSTIAKISKFIKSPSFAADEIRKVSKAAGALCVWCHAIHLYAGVAKEVAPKRARLKTAQEGLAQKQEDLTKAKDALVAATTRLTQLKEQYDSSVTKKNQLTSEALDLEDKLNRAEKLINGLSGEYTRWTDSIGLIEIQTGTLIGDVVVSSAFLSYAGPFDTFYRSKVVELWTSDVNSKGFLTSAEFSTTNFLSSSVEIREWSSQGLPKDDFSIENAIVVTKSSRWPLLIDPQGQGTSWVKSMEGDALKLIDVKSKDFMRDLELAISFGLPALLLNTVEQLDTSLEPILSKAVVKSGGRDVINLGDKEIDFNENFRLYITTSLGNPHYTPEVSAKTNVVNFAVTEIGLEEQLLAFVVNEEEPHLESQKSDLVIELAVGRKTLVELEDNILLLLSESSGSLIDDIKLINTLQTSKTTAENMNRQLDRAKETEKNIDIARESFRSAARRSSIIFFTLKDLSLVDPMYQYSLDSYMDAFRSNILKSREEEQSSTKKDENRVELINRYHTLNVFESTSFGLFGNDKTLFALQLCLRIMRNKGDIPKDEFEFLCQGKILTEESNTTDTTSLQWLSDKASNSLSFLDKIIEGFAEGLQEQEEEWIVWFNSEKPEIIPLPGEWESKLSLLQKLCVLRALRLDRLLFAVSQFISFNIGQEFSNPPAFDLAKIFDKSSFRTPLIFILAPGVDPTDQIANLAESYTTKFTQVALGQGQAPVALNAIKEACKNGSWILLSNCHLMLSWMEDLENIFENECCNNHTHQNFRLWLSSKPSAYFPLRILQRGIKMTTEPPRGLRSNMIKLYSMISHTDFTKCKQDMKYKKYLFSLSWLHSILLERRKFKTLGFNKPYDFNDSDFLICHDLLIVLLDEYPKSTPFKALQYLIGEANYGGRVTDEWDQKLLGVYVETFFCEEVMQQNQFLLSDLPEYYVPRDGNLDSYKSYIAQLPHIDDPAAFGQHPNAEISSQIEEANSLLNTLSELRSDRILVGGNDGNTGELIISKLDKIPGPFDVGQIESYNKRTFDPSAMKTFLLQEVQRYNCLLALLKQTKDDLHMAMKGLIVLSPQLESVMNKLVDFKVPSKWLQFYPSMKPLDSWINDLCERIKQLDQWINNETPKVFWLSGFAYPSCFLTSVLQTTARNKGCAIDSLSWEFHLMKKGENISARPDDGVYITGLYLEGAQWDSANGNLIEPMPMTIQSEMPIIHFKPTETKKRNKDDMYNCPLYAYPQRAGTSQWSSFVLAVDLKRGNKSARHWAKRGVALLLSTSE